MILLCLLDGVWPTPVQLPYLLSGVCAVTAGALLYVDLKGGDRIQVSLLFIIGSLLLLYAQGQNTSFSLVDAISRNTLLLTMNNFEYAFARTVGAPGDLVFEVEGAGERVRNGSIRVGLHEPGVEARKALLFQATCARRVVANPPCERHSHDRHAEGEHTGQQPFGPTPRKARRTLWEPT